MAVNDELPWRLRHRARRCPSLWQMLHFRTLPKRYFGFLRPLPADLPPRPFPPKYAGKEYDPLPRALCVSNVC
eukprot:4652125-Lingulodinium_polyedra.AAC.1